MEKIKLGELSKDSFVMILAAVSLAIKNLDDSRNGKRIEKALEEWQSVLDEDAALMAKKALYAGKLFSIASLDSILKSAKAAKDSAKGEE